MLLYDLFDLSPSKPIQMLLVQPLFRKQTALPNAQLVDQLVVQLVVQTDNVELCL
jgi:hypothetical protein